MFAVYDSDTFVTLRQGDLVDPEQRSLSTIRMRPVPLFSYSLTTDGHCHSSHVIYTRSFTNYACWTHPSLALRIRRQNIQHRAFREREREGRKSTNVEVITHTTGDTAYYMKIASVVHTVLHSTETKLTNSPAALFHVRSVCTNETNAKVCQLNKYIQRKVVNGLRFSLPYCRGFDHYLCGQLCIWYLLQVCILCFLPQVSRPPAMDQALLTACRSFKGTNCESIPYAGVQVTSYATGVVWCRCSDRWPVQSYIGRTSS